jgi:hypothetical protein
MSTKIRHNRLTGALNGNIFGFMKSGQMNAMQENCALVYYGEKPDCDWLRLVDVTELADRDEFIDGIMNDLDYVMPDFLFFKDNQYLENRRQTRTAGQPDLIVEVWSEFNTPYDREKKFELYASSSITEHWYIEQDSNIIKCCMGASELPSQNLKDILRTRGGIEFDLRYLAL